MNSLARSLIVLSCALSAFAESSLTMSLAPGRPSNDSVSVVVTLKNVGTASLRLLNDPNSVLSSEWHTDTWTFENSGDDSTDLPSFHGVKVSLNVPLSHNCAGMPL